MDANIEIAEVGGLEKSNKRRSRVYTHPEASAPSIEPNDDCIRVSEFDGGVH